MYLQELPDFNGCPDLVGLTEAQRLELHAKHTGARDERKAMEAANGVTTLSPEPTTITFTPYTTYEFIGAGYNGDGQDENEKLMVANLAYWTITSNVRYIPLCVAVSLSSSD
jgi:hypothetical protein